MTIGEAFGETADGVVRRVTIAGGGLTAHVLSWGGVVQDLRLEGHAPPLVLGLREGSRIIRAHSPYFGAIPGRCANRIANASFELDGHEYRLDPNFLGKHQLHGGSKGFGKRLWTFVDHGPDIRDAGARLRRRRHGLSGPAHGALHLSPDRRGRRSRSSSPRRPTRRRSAISPITATSISTMAARRRSSTIRWRLLPTAISRSTTS